MIFTVRNGLFLVFCLLFGSSAPAAGLSLHHHLDPETGRLASGEGQLGKPGAEFPELLRAEVRGSDGKPVPGVMVQFDLVAPGTHFLGQAATDSLGIVYFPMTATNKARSHTVVASSEIHLELMDSYRRISSYSTNVGRAIMSRDKFGDPDYEED